MKVYKYLCLITISLLFSNSIFSQFDDYIIDDFELYDVRTLKMVGDEFLIDKSLYSFYTKNTGIGEDLNFWGDTGFGGSNFATLNAGLMVEARKRAALEAWYDKQRGLIKGEIEEFYNQSFNSFNEAVDKTFIDFGKSNYNYFDWNVSSLKSNHNNKNRQYKALNKVNVRELHNLNYRKQEILSGNINNSIFTFSEIYGGNKLKDIKDVNGINTNWNIIKGFLDTNLPTEQNAKYHSEELGNLDDKFDNFMLGLQRSFYDNNLNPGQRLFLEQFSINLLKAYRANPNAFGVPNAPLNLNIPDNLGAGLSVPTGNQSVLQSYLWGYSKRSVFDPNYYLKVLDEILVNNGMQPVYGDVNKINRYLRYAYINIAKAQATERRNNAFNDLMNSSNTEDILTDLFITALGERNNAFLDARPALREEVEKYFKANNRSQVSHDGINWTLNQFQDNNVFPVNENLFKSKNSPLFQDGSNQNRAIKIDFNQQAITEGITNFGNVIAELLKDNSKPEFEGSLMRTIFVINGINLPNNLTNPILGSYYRFLKNNGNSISIHFEGNLGSYLFNLGINNINFLNKLGIGEAEMFLDHLKLFQNTPIKFSKLWENYKTIEGTHIINEDKDDFPNYCAINLSHALLNTGIPLNELDKKKLCWGCKSINNNRKHFIRARELKDWLNANNINGLNAPKLLTGNNFESYIDGKKGIVYFEDYWARSTDTPPNRTSDHIDLWDGNELAGSTWIGTRFRLIFPWIAERFGTSDLRKSKKVIFWEIKD